MEEKLLNIINTVCENADVDKISDLKPEIHLRNDLQLDSLDLAELTVRIEEQFDIDIFEDSIVSTVGEIIEKLNNK
jgi:acyl carrier protein